MTGSGRSGSWRFQQNRRLVLAASDTCALCGHHGARTVDHVISKPDWPRLPGGKLAPGFDDLVNLQPAHGSMGSNATRREPDNRCGICGKLCNQAKGAGHRPPSVRSRVWL